MPLNLPLIQMCMHIKQSSVIFSLKSATAAKCALPVPLRCLVMLGCCCRLKLRCNRLCFTAPHLLHNSSLLNLQTC